MSAIHITTIQSNLYWEDKEANLQQFEKKIKEIPTPRAIVVLPEMFSTGFSMNAEKLAEKMDGETVAWMKRVAMEQRVILVGSVIVEEEGAYFNRLIWMLPNGVSSYYDKRHLFGYAGEDRYYTSGEKRLICSVNGWRINLQICYDLRFPVWARQQTSMAEEAEYDVLIYVANWPERRSHAWKTLLCARAIENQCYVVGVNRVGKDANGVYHSGDSMVIHPLGEVLYHMAHEEEAFTITLQKQELTEIRKQLPFLKDADQFRIVSV